MLVHRRVTPSSMSPVPIYTPEWRDIKWSKVPCVRKQRDGQGLNLTPPDPEFEVLTAGPHTPPPLFSSNLNSLLLNSRVTWDSREILWKDERTLSDRKVPYRELTTTATTAKTSLRKRARAVSNFITLVPFHTICSMLWNSSGVDSKALFLSSEKENENRCLAFTSSIKRGTAKFHVAVVQRRQRNDKIAWCTCRLIVLPI